MNVVTAIRADARRHLSGWGKQSFGLGDLLRLSFLCPGFQLALSIRMQALLGRLPLVGKLLRRMLWYCTTIWFGCDIDPACSFGPGIYFPHPTAIVIGGEWDFGAGVSIYQCVTLGRRTPKHPTGRAYVEDNVLISAGAKVIGTLNIGQGSTIGANAVVVKDVPPFSVAVGVPARSLSRKSASEDLSSRLAQVEHLESDGVCA